MKVMACRCQIVAEMVEMAPHFEDEYKKFMENRPKGKAKKSFASLFSFFGMQGHSTILGALERRGGIGLAVSLVADTALQVGATQVSAK